MLCKKQPPENLLNDLCGGFFQVVYIKDFGQRHPSHFWIFIQADIQRRWSELSPARHHQSEQQHRSPHHRDRSSPRLPLADTGHGGVPLRSESQKKKKKTNKQTSKNETSAPCFFSRIKARQDTGYAMQTNVEFPQTCSVSVLLSDHYY